MADVLMKNSIKNSSEQLLQKVLSIEEGGKTALGPALLASLSMLAKSSKPGSMVYIIINLINQKEYLLNFQ